MNRIKAIDIAKGIGILAVIIGHCYSTPGYILVKILYAFHMPLFFIISGILLANKESNGKSLEIKKAAHLLANKESNGKSLEIKKAAHSLLIPYFIFDILFSICISVSTGFTELGNNILSTISFVGITATWFLPCLFFVEVLFWFLEHVNDKIRIIIIIALFIIGLFCPSIGYLKVLLRVFIGLGFYSLGFYFSKVLLQLQKWYISIVLIIAFIASALCNDTIDLYSMKLGNPVLYTISSMCGSMLLLQFSIFLSSKNHKIQNGITFLGRNTLIILCTHVFLIEIIRIIDNKCFGDILPFLGAFEGIVFCMLIVSLEIPVILF